MKPIVKSVNWLDIAIISFAIFGVVLGDFKGFGSYPSITALLFFMIIVTAIAFVLKLIGVIGKIGSDDKMKTVNWINLGLIFLAYSLIINSAQVAFHDYSSGYWVTIRYLSAGVVIIGTALYFYKSRRSKAIAIDERTSEITNRSARNALAATWFGLLLMAGSPVGGSAETSPSDLETNFQSWGKGMVTAMSDHAEKTLAVVIIAVMIFLGSIYIYRKQAHDG